MTRLFAVALRSPSRLDGIPWAGDEIDRWVVELKDVYTDKKLEDKVRHYARTLCHSWEIWEEVKSKTKGKGTKLFTGVKNAVARIFAEEPGGRDLEEIYNSGAYDEEEVARILFVHAFRRVVGQPENLLDTTMVERWGEIESLKDSVKQLEEQQPSTKEGG